MSLQPDFDGRRELRKEGSDDGKVPGEEQDTAWRENREARYLEKFKAEHKGMTPQEYAVYYREQKQKEEDNV